MRQPRTGGDDGQHGHVARCPRRDRRAHLQAHPNFAVVQGRHEYDGQLPDWSAEGIAAETKRLHAAKDRLTAVPRALSRVGRDSSATF
jgi:hypothetical protein